MTFNIDPMINQLRVRQRPDVISLFNDILAVERPNSRQGVAAVAAQALNCFIRNGDETGIRPSDICNYHFGTT